MSHLVDSRARMPPSVGRLLLSAQILSGQSEERGHRIEGGHSPLVSGLLSVAYRPPAGRCESRAAGAPPSASSSVGYSSRRRRMASSASCSPGALRCAEGQGENQDVDGTTHCDHTIPGD